MSGSYTCLSPFNTMLSRFRPRPISVKSPTWVEITHVCPHSIPCIYTKTYFLGHPFIDLACCVVCPHGCDVPRTYTKTYFLGRPFIDVACCVVFPYSCDATKKLSFTFSVVYPYSCDATNKLPFTFSVVYQYSCDATNKLPFNLIHVLYPHA